MVEKTSVLGAYEAVDGDKVSNEITPLVAQATVERTRVTEALTGLHDREPSQEELDAALATDGGYQEVVGNPEYTKQVAADELLGTVTSESQQGALFKVAIFPALMFVCYVLLILYFRSRGGYKAEVLVANEGQSD